IVHQFRAPDVRRALIEAAVHNRACLGHVGWADHLPSVDSDLGRALSFVHGHAPWYVNAQTRADVAVLRSRHSLVNNWADAYQALMSVQQCLYCHGIQYDVVLESQLDDLSNYRLLVL